MTVITISRQLGSHGEEVATRVADTLGLRLVDAEAINRAAERAGVPQVALAEWKREGERSLADQVLNALRTMPSTVPLAFPDVESGAGLPGESAGLTIPFVGLFSPLAPPISASVESYVHMVGLVIQGLAREGDVLIMGRGGQVLLRDHPTALHIQIVAPRSYRLQVIMDRYSLDKRAAQHRLRASDRARFDYLRRYHDADWLDPTLYHLVLNTGRLAVEAAADLIVAAQEAQAGESGRPQ